MATCLSVSLAVLFALGATRLTGGASAPPQTPAPPSGCQSPDHRAFDFWIGQWVVYDPAGNVAGHNTLELVLGGCALHESWESATGGAGHSYSFYDAAEARWHQTWIDAAGNALYLDGGWTGEAMVLGDGTNRITWTPIEGGVRQHWETTSDGGATWSTAFDGHYVPARQE